MSLSSFKKGIKKQREAFILLTKYKQRKLIASEIDVNVNVSYLIIIFFFLFYLVGTLNIDGNFMQICRHSMLVNIIQFF